MKKILFNMALGILGILFLIALGSIVHTTFGLTATIIFGITSGLLIPIIGIMTWINMDKKQ